MTNFGFRVRAIGTTDRWLVDLPHRCGQWVIAGDTEEFFDKDVAVPWTDAMIQLDGFIDQALNARDLLRRRVQSG